MSSSLAGKPSSPSLLHHKNKYRTGHKSSYVRKPRDAASCPSTKLGHPAYNLNQYPVTEYYDRRDPDNLDKEKQYHQCPDTGLWKKEHIRPHNPCYRAAGAYTGDAGVKICKYVK